MSNVLVLWRAREGTKRSRAFIYLVLAEGIPCDGVEPLDVEAVERDLESNCPGWREGASALAADISTASIQVTIMSGSRGDEARRALAELAKRHGLQCFDPAAEKISAKDERAAAAYVEKHADIAQRDEVGVWARAAAAGDANAMNELGNAYSFGEGVNEDPVLAAQWYSRGAALRHPLAMANLAECYLRGEGVTRDSDRAVAWLDRAGDAGNMEALVRLAEILRSGDGVPRDPARAMAALERASRVEQEVSVFMLAEMYESGEAGLRDVERAKELYRVALAHRHPEARLRLRRLGVDA